MKNKKIVNILMAAMFALVLVVYLPLLFKTNLVASDFPQTSSEVVEIGFSPPLAWSNTNGGGFGENKILSLWSYPIDFLFGFGATIGLDFKTTTLIVLILPALTSALIGMFYLGLSFGLRAHASFASSVFYILTTYALLILDGGQISLFLAYGFLPISFLALNECKKSNFSLEKISLYSLSMIILSVADLRFFYMHLLVSAVIFTHGFISEKRKAIYFFGVVKTMLVVIALWLLVNLFWILPLVFNLSGNSAVSYLTSNSQLDFLNFTQLFNSIFLQQPNWPLNSFGRLSTPDALFVVALIPLPILLFVFRKNKTINLLSLCYILGVFLAKGINPPFGFIYEFMFTNIPGFSMFRDSSKFFAVSSLFFSLIIGFLVNQNINKKRTSILLTCVLFYLLSVTNPIWRGKMTGLFSENPNQKEYEALDEKFASERDYGRVLWLPSRVPLGNTTLLNPSLDGFILSNKHLYQAANVGTYERFNFLREPVYANHLLNISSIEYVAYPLPDKRKVDLKQEDYDYYDNFSSQLLGTGYLSNLLSTDSLRVFKNNQNQNKIYFSPNLYWIVGDQSILNLVPNSNYILDYPMVFTEKVSGLRESFVANDFGKFVIGSMRDKSDLVSLLSIKGDDLVLRSEIDGGFWNADIGAINQFREFLNTKYSLDTIDMNISSQAYVFEGDSLLKIQNKNEKEILLLKVFHSPKSGVLNFYESVFDLKSNYGKVLGGISSDIDRPMYDLGTFKWVAINTGGAENVEIQFRGGEINIVTDIALVSSESMNNALQLFDSLEKSGRIIDYSQFSSEISEGSKGQSVSWEMVSPVEYSLSSQIDKKGVIVFSQSYDQKWQLSGKNSVPAFSVSNLFVYNPESGLQTIYYSGQDGLNPLLIIISLVTSISLIIICFVFVFRKLKFRK